MRGWSPSRWVKSTTLCFTEQLLTPSFHWSVFLPAILPRGRKWPEEGVCREKSRAGFSALRPLVVLPEHRCPHQDVCYHAALPRWWNACCSVFTLSVWARTCSTITSVLSFPLSVHNGMGIRITGNEKIRPDRGKSVLGKRRLLALYCLICKKMWKNIVTYPRKSHASELSRSC